MRISFVKILDNSKIKTHFIYCFLPFKGEAEDIKKVDAPEKQWTNLLFSRRNVFLVALTLPVRTVKRGSG